MKFTVTYFSQSGNTRKVAEAIADALPGDVTRGDLASAPAMDEADVVFVGMPVVRFGAPDEVRDYLRRDCAGRDVALFVTHAAPEDMESSSPGSTPAATPRPGPAWWASSTVRGSWPSR